MKKIIHANIENKSLSFELSASAIKKLSHTDRPVYIGLELYFSCFVKKIITAFDKKPQRKLYQIYDNLFVYFRPVQSKSCNIKDLVGTNSPTLIDFPVTKRRALIPDTVQLNYKKSKGWHGDFTWHRPGKKKLINTKPTEQAMEEVLSFI